MFNLECCGFHRSLCGRGTKLLLSKVLVASSVALASRLGLFLEGPLRCSNRQNDLSGSRLKFLPSAESQLEACTEGAC